MASTLDISLDPPRASWRDTDMRLRFTLLAFALVAGRLASDVPPPLHIVHAYGVKGAALWIDADSGVTADAQGQVTRLVDHMGNFTLKPPGHGPTLVSKALNGHAAFCFMGQQSLFSPYGFDSSLDRAMTFIVVASSTAAADNQRYSIYLGGNAQAHCNRALCQYHGKQVLDGQFVIAYGEPVERNAFTIDAATLNPGKVRATFYRNGKLMLTSGLAIENGSARFDQLSDGVTLGAAPTNLYGWEGDIAEVIVFDRQLSPEELQTISTALSAKYKISGASPAQAGG